MTLVECRACGAINRFQSFRLRHPAICGRCQAPVAEPYWVRTARWVFGPGGWVVALVLAWFAYAQPFAFQKDGADASAGRPATRAPQPDKTDTVEHMDMRSVDGPWTRYQQADASPTSESRLREQYARPAPAVVPQGEVITTARILQASLQPPRAPFSVVTPTGTGGFYLKLVDVSTNRTVMTMVMPAGGRHEFKVPLGVYRLRYATGPGWLDGTRHFGPETLYAEADADLAFEIEGNSITGHTITLILQADGNLRTEALTAQTF